MIRQVTAYEAFVILRNVFLFGSIFCFGYHSASALMLDRRSDDGIFR